MPEHVQIRFHYHKKISDYSGLCCLPYNSLEITKAMYYFPYTCNYCDYIPYRNSRSPGHTKQHTYKSGCDYYYWYDNQRQNYDARCTYVCIPEKTDESLKNYKNDSKRSGKYTVKFHLMQMWLGGGFTLWRSICQVEAHRADWMDGR